MRNLLAIGTLALLGVASIGAALAVEKEALVKPEKLYAAIVAANGTIINSVDVDSVSRTSIGQYTIFFNKKIEQCYQAATIFSGTSGAIRTAEVAGEPKRLFVRTRSEGTATVNPDFADRAFSIVVLCP